MKKFGGRNMRKTLYSLILSEDVVKEIDRLAEKEGTNRSNLINEVLAEYVSVTTPEKRIADVFKRIENFFGANGDFPVYYENHDNTLSIKSALSYRYRPTLRYEVELYRAPEGTFGELKVNFRTQSPELLNKLTEFFAYWERMEEIYVFSLFNAGNITYSLDEYKWTRSLSFPKNRRYETEDLSRAISDYVKVFDRLLKKFLAGEYKSVRELENDYLAALNGGMLLI